MASFVRDKIASFADDEVITVPQLVKAAMEAGSKSNTHALYSNIRALLLAETRKGRLHYDKGVGWSKKKGSSTLRAIAGPHGTILER